LGYRLIGNALEPTIRIDTGFRGRITSVEALSTFVDVSTERESITLVARPAFAQETARGIGAHGVFGARFQQTFVDISTAIRSAETRETGTNPSLTDTVAAAVVRASRGLGTIQSNETRIAEADAVLTDAIAAAVVGAGLTDVVFIHLAVAVVVHTVADLGTGLLGRLTE